MTARIRALTPRRLPAPTQPPGVPAPVVPPALPAPRALPVPPARPQAGPGPTPPPKIAAPVVPPPPPVPPVSPPAGPAPIRPPHLTQPPPAPGSRDGLTATHAVQAVRAAVLARRALTAVLTGGTVPEPWIETVTTPGRDHAGEQHAYTLLITAIADYRRRGTTPARTSSAPAPTAITAAEWDHLTDALDAYTQSRIQARLDALRQRGTAARAGLAPPHQPAPTTRPQRQPARPPGPSAPDTRPAPGQRA